MVLVAFETQPSAGSGFSVIKEPDSTATENRPLNHKPIEHTNLFVCPKWPDTAQVVSGEAWVFNYVGILVARAATTSDG